MASPLVHMVGDMPLKLKLGRPVHTRCGLDAIPTAYKQDLNRYTLTNLTGGDFEGTTVKRLCTCQKCVNLTTIGMIHAKAVRKTRR
jgi:hypothetical protein